MKVLVIDVGGTNVKVLVSGKTEPRKFPSGPTMTPLEMVKGVKDLTHDWKFDAVTIGFPAPVHRDQIMAEPANLAAGWVGFDFETAFGRPVKLINDAAMQALGSYQEGVMLFLGLGTGLGSALIVHGQIVPLELGHLPYRRHTFEEYLGVHGMERDGKKKWRARVELAVADLMAAFHPDDVVLGGGNVKHLKDLPPACRAGSNANAFTGGFRMWKTVGNRGKKSK